VVLASPNDSIENGPINSYSGVERTHSSTPKPRLHKFFNKLKEVGNKVGKVGAVGVVVIALAYAESEAYTQNHKKSAPASTPAKKGEALANTSDTVALDKVPSDPALLIGHPTTTTSPAEVEQFVPKLGDGEPDSTMGREAIAAGKDMFFGLYSGHINNVLSVECIMGPEISIESGQGIDETLARGNGLDMHSTDEFQMEDNYLLSVAAHEANIEYKKIESIDQVVHPGDKLLTFERCEVTDFLYTNSIPAQLYGILQHDPKNSQPHWDAWQVDGTGNMVKAVPTNG